MELSTTEIILIGVLFLAVVAIGYLLRENRQLAHDLRDMSPPWAWDMARGVVFRGLDELKKHTDKTPNTIDNDLEARARKQATDFFDGTPDVDTVVTSSNEVYQREYGTGKLVAVAKLPPTQVVPPPSPAEITAPPVGFPNG